MVKKNKARKKREREKKKKKMKNPSVSGKLAKDGTVG
jgi:hypothetical protein